MLSGTMYLSIGIFLVLISIYVEIRHKHIWSCCKHKIDNPNKGFVNYITQPNKLSYMVNIYFIWPVLFILGVLCIKIGLNL